jgi:hypothetical protein
MTKQAALALSKTKWWENATQETIAKFQLVEEMLCCPFDVFHKALENTLGRPIWTHELALNRDGIIDELFHGKPPPTMDEIINLIPESKRIVIVK